MYMLDRDIAVLEEFSFESLYDVMAIISQVYVNKYVFSNNLGYEYLNETSYLGIDNKNKDTLAILEKIKDLIKDLYLANGEYDKAKPEQIDETRYEPVLCKILRSQYLSLLEKKKESINGKTLKGRNSFCKPFTATTKKLDLDWIQDPNVLNEGILYHNLSETTAFTFFRRFRKDISRLCLTEIDLLISSSCFPLKPIITFPKNSAKRKKYTPIFKRIDSLEEQLYCYLGMEGINPLKLATMVLEMDSRTALYRQLKYGKMNFKCFFIILDIFDAKVEIVLTDDVIAKYKKYQSVFKTTSSLYEYNYNNSDDKTELINNINSVIKEDILKNNIDLQIVDYLIEMEEIRKKNEENEEAEKVKKTIKQ